MIRAVSTRWNTTAELIGRAKDLRLALNLLVNMEQHNKMRGVRLKRFQLSTQEWDLLLQLYPLLDVSTIVLSPRANTSLPAGRRKESPTRSFNFDPKRKVGIGPGCSYGGQRRRFTSLERERMYSSAHVRRMSFVSRFEKSESGLAVAMGASGVNALTWSWKECTL